jgi:asparagine synthase (glutamine-hydrolysing)
VRSFQAVLAAGHFRGNHGIHFSHPYSHQQLIDFALSLPMDQLVRPGEGRSLMRRAMRGVLPEKIRNRRSKGGTDEAFCRTLAYEKHIIGNASTMLVCAKGYAEPAAVAEAIREASIGKINQSGALSRLLSLEQWLRSLQTIESRRSTLKVMSQGRSLIGVA